MRRNRAFYKKRNTRLERRKRGGGRLGLALTCASRRRRRGWDGGGGGGGGDEGRLAGEGERRASMPFGSGTLFLFFSPFFFSVRVSITHLEQKLEKEGGEAGGMGGGDGMGGTRSSTISILPRRTGKDHALVQLGFLSFFWQKRAHQPEEITISYFFNTRLARNQGVNEAA